MAWPAQMVVEPGDEISGLPEEGNGQAAPTASRTGPASSMENQEGRGQQGFEGPEKTLEIEFEPDVGHEEGLRAIRREQWDAILEQVRALQL